MLLIGLYSVKQYPVSPLHPSYKISIKKMSNSAVYPPCELHKVNLYEPGKPCTGAV